MLTLTLTEALDYTDEDKMDGHYLYLYRDGDVIFYVGQSVDPQRRLYEHLGIRDARGSGDDVGQIMHDNYPASLLWTVELFTPADCEPFMASYETPKRLAWYRRMLAQIETEEITSFHLRGVIDEAEVALIAHFHPCMNIRYALYSNNPIPERYREEERKRNQEIRRRMRET